MSYSNYRQIENALIARDNFDGNSASAKWVGSEYRVISYSTLIARIGSGGEVWISPVRYSRTTSRLQNIVKRAWGIK